jgi:hypothetical protein
VSEHNAADRKSVKERERQEKSAAERDQQDLINVLSTESGRRFVWGLLTETRVYQEVYDPSGQKMAYNAGMRAVGLRLLGLCMTADAAATLAMQIEQADPDERRRVTLALRNTLTC